MNTQYILHFVCYSPQVYAGLDKFFVLLTKKLIAKGITPVFVYGETLEAVPQIWKDLAGAGAIVETMPTQGKKAMIYAIRKYYDKYKPLLVNVHFVSFVKAYAALLSIFRRVKHVTHIHSLLSSCTPDEYVKKKGFIRRWLLGVFYAFINHSGKVICVSKAIEQQCREWAYGKKDNVQTLYLGTDLTPSKLTKQQARERLGLPSDKIIITNVSAIEKIKGIDIIIKAVALLKKRGVDVMFVHIGGLRIDTQLNRDYADSLKQLAKKEGVDGNIIWLGRRYDVQDIMLAFDIYVHPSRSEGLGCVLMEASVSGLPLVGSRVGGIVEVIENGEDGFLCENEDVNQLADALQCMALNPELRMNFGKKAYERAHEFFDMDKQTDKLIKLYEL